MNLARLRSTIGVPWQLLYIVAASLLFSSCTLKEASPERPYPSESRVSRGFFEVQGTDGKVRLRTFLAGWTPEMTAGEYSTEIFDHYNHAGHANIVFEITEDKLVGKMVNPSFLSAKVDCFLRDSQAAKDCRARWANVVTIPISKHFYYERRKDSRGRLTDEYIENDQRSHWSARPYLNLALGGVQIKDWGMQLMWPGMDVDNVDHIEWDFQKQFLGFTITATHPSIGAAVQGTFRFNFLAFEHDEEFTKKEITPYRPANAKHINVLHVIGKYHNGDLENPILYAAHWKTGKDKNGKPIKHQISLWGFPREHEKIGFDVIEQWNDAFEKVGRGRPFEAVVSNRQYSFDLRYPTIAWISDRRLSANAPLGVGMALADVRNGEIKWGMVTMWSGEIDNYINAYSPNSDNGGINAKGGRPLVQLSLMEPKRLLPSGRSSLPESLLGGVSYEAARASLMSSFGKEAEGLRQMQDRLAEATPESLRKLQNPEEPNLVTALVDSAAGRKNVSLTDISGIVLQKKEHLEEILSKKSQLVEQMARDMVGVSGRFQQMALQNGPTEKIFNAEYLQRLINQPKLEESLDSLPTYNRALLREKLARRGDMTRTDILALLNAQPTTTDKWSPAAFDADRRFSDVADSWALGIAKYNVDKREAFRSIMKNVMLHEWGHVVGMGHNFKENILPEDGSLPHSSEHMGWIHGHGDKKFENFSMQTLKRDAKSFTNYTTVMGYMSGETEIAIPYDQLKIGPADMLSLHYLYNQQYPVYPKDANGQGDITFEKLRPDGFIYENLTRNNRSLKPAFFPACNDFYASMGIDPYCNRWDRGYNATTLVENYFEGLKGNLAASLTAYSNTVKGGSYWMSEARLWHRFLNSLSRARVFYDYMRQRYEADFKKIIDGGSEQGVQNLLDFSDSCQKVARGERAGNALLQQLFSDKSKRELLDLCVANAKMVGELESFLQLDGRDYTQIDYFDKYMSYMTGGEGGTAFSRAFGSWKELARTPIKISSLLTLTSPYPFNSYGGWTWPIEQYSREDGAYHISTLYPKEYTSAITAATEMNLNFGNAALDEKTSIGRTVLAMGYYLFNTTGSNDVLSVNAPFIENIRSQTQFKYSWAMVDIKKKDEQNKEIARKFTATIHNIYSVAPETVPEIYMYKNMRTVMMPPARSLLLPVSSIHWYTKSAGYFFAMKLDYNDDPYDRLKAKSVRKTLEEKYYEVMKRCVQGNRNGLRFFFSDTAVDEKAFPGFEFPATIADSTSDEKRFWQSVDKYFNDYYNYKGFPERPDPSACEEALRGQGLIVMAASVLNGYYLYNVTDFVEKGY